MKKSFITYLQLETRLVTQSPIQWFKWQSLQSAFVKEHNYCEMCGWQKKLNVHHIIPRHIDISLALEWSNLITLCRECHFRFGHFLNWQDYNPYIVELVNSKHRWASMLANMVLSQGDISHTLRCPFCGAPFLVNTDGDPFVECVNGHLFDATALYRVN